MECPQCGTWNPDDKKVCWRCQAPLPKPEPQKPPRTTPQILGMPWWVFVLMFLMLVSPMLLSRCLAP